MTLARKNSDGSKSIGGVWCNDCGQDTYHRVLRSGKTKCDRCGASSEYRPRGLVIKTFRDSAT